MNWLGHVSQIWEVGEAHTVLVRKLEGKRLLEDIEVDGRII
jgi:hypothetical protein